MGGQGSRRSAVVRACIMGSCLVAACQDTSLTHPTTVASQDEAAAVLISVTNVAPWDQVAAAMQPNFALTGDQALTQVLPVTERIQEQVLSAFGASLGIGLPQSFGQSTATRTAQSSTTTTTPATGPTTTTATSTTGTNASATSTTQPGVVPNVPTSVPAGGQLPAALPITSDIGLDPVLKYQAALNLFESVQMMNREIQNAAVLPCYVPFLIRLRVAVLPYRPNLAYTSHSRVAFFPNEATGDKNQGKPGSGITPLIKPASGVAPSACNDASYLPQIVPILAADDIERALKSRAAEAAQQIGLALSAMIQGVGGNLALNNLNQSLKAISGQDFNSRLTVTRQSDNTLYVRIGATEQATAGLALAAQNYDIALILLAPRAYFSYQESASTPISAVDRQVRVVTHTQFRNVFDGSVLDDRPVGTLVRQIDRVMREILVGPNRAGLLASWDRLDPTGKEAVARALAGPIQESRFDKFLEVLNKPFEHTGTPSFSLAPIVEDGAKRPVPTDSAKTLWVSTSTVLADTALKSAFFQLRWPADVTLAANQTALVLDDGKSKSQVQLQTLSGTSAASILGNLNLTTKGPNARAYSLPAQSVALDPNAHLLTLTFPSPTQAGIGNIDLAEVTLSQVLCSPEILCPKLVAPVSFKVLLAKTEASDAVPNFTLSQNVKQIAPDKSTGTTGTATVSITKLTDDSATITLADVDVASAKDASGTPLPLTNGNSVTVTKDATVIFSLNNLRIGAIVTVTAEGKKSNASTGKKTLQFAVVPSG